MLFGVIRMKSAQAAVVLHTGSLIHIRYPFTYSSVVLKDACVSSLKTALMIQCLSIETATHKTKNPSVFSS